MLYGHKTTALTWDFERRASQLARVTRFWDPDYYRTYSERPGDPVGYMSVEAEVTRALENPADFCDVPKDSPHRRMQTSGMVRDTATDSRSAFVVDDGRYLSARWLGDTHTFACRRVGEAARNTVRRQNFATAPASTGSAAPVMYCDSSDARKSTASLTARASISGFGNM